MSSVLRQLRVAAPGLCDLHLIYNRLQLQPPLRKLFLQFCLTWRAFSQDSPSPSPSPGVRNWTCFLGLEVSLQEMDSSFPPVSPTSVQNLPQGCCSQAAKTTAQPSQPEEKSPPGQLWRAHVVSWKRLYVTLGDKEGNLRGSPVEYHLPTPAAAAHC